MECFSLLLGFLYFFFIVVLLLPSMMYNTAYVMFVSAITWKTITFPSLLIFLPVMSVYVFIHGLCFLFALSLFPHDVCCPKYSRFPHPFSIGKNWWSFLRQPHRTEVDGTGSFLNKGSVCFFVTGGSPLSLPVLRLLYISYL